LIRAAADLPWRPKAARAKRSSAGSSERVDRTWPLGAALNTGGSTDPQRLTFTGVKAGTYFPGNGCPDGIHYDVKGNLWAAAGRLGGILQIDPRGIILGFVPVPNGDLSTTNSAFGGPDNCDIFLEGAVSGTIWRFKAPFPGLISPGGARLPAQP
jgi:gluconolactonase